MVYFRTMKHAWAQSLNNSLINAHKLLSSNCSSTAIRISACKLFRSTLLNDFNRSCHFFLGMVFAGFRRFCFTISESFQVSFRFLVLLSCSSRISKEDCSLADGEKRFKREHPSVARFRVA